jgi:hypothetical protein
MPEIIPNVTVDDPTAATANVTAIDSAIATWRTQAQAGGQGGRIVFPPGKVWINRAILLYETEAGITLEGQGWNLDNQDPPQFDPGPTGNTIILNSSGGSYPDSTALLVLSRNIGYADGFVIPYTGPNQLTLAGSIDPAPYVVGDYVFLFKLDGSATVRNPCQTLKITAKDPLNPRLLTSDRNIDSPAYTALKYLKNSRGVTADVAPSATLVTLAGDGGDLDAALFAVGDYVFISDGVGVNEIFGEYMKIASITVDEMTGAVTIGFVTGVAGVNGATYAAAKTVLIPGPWAKGITVRNLQFGGNGVTGENASWSLKFAPDFRAASVRTWQSDTSLTLHAFVTTTCANALFLNCQFESGVQVNSCHDLRFINCVINNAVHEEWVRRVYHTNNEIQNGCAAQTNSFRLNFLGCRFHCMTNVGANGFVLGAGGQHTLIDCEFDSASPVIPLFQAGQNYLAHLRGDCWRSLLDRQRLGKHPLHVNDPGCRLRRRHRPASR